VAKNLDEQDAMRRIIRSVDVLNLSGDGRAAPIPVADVAIAPAKLADFLEKAANSFKATGLAPAMWGRAGEGVVVIQPVLDLSQLGDRQKLFKLGDSMYKLAGDMGGTITATAGDGRLRAPKLEQLYGKKTYDLMQDVKKIFDPHDILNPGVKFGTTDKDIKMLLSAPYRPHHRFDHPAL
jgi:FAD/FMN-containing dehydrogenase